MANKVLSFLVKPFVKIVFSIMIIGFLLYWLPISELWKNIQKITFISWFMVLVGFLSGHVVGSVKWRLLVNINSSKLPILQAVRFYFAGLFSNLFLPSLAGGDIVKAGLAIRYGHPKGITILGTITDRIIDTISVVIIILIAALLSPKFLQAADQKIVLAMIVIFISMFITVTFFLMIPSEKIPLRTLSNGIEKIKGIVFNILKQPLRPLLALFLSLIIQAVFITLTIYLAGILSLNIPTVLWFLVWPLAKLSALLPISLGGIGVREVALAALLGRLSIPAADSVALGLIWESILIVGGLCGGLAYIILRAVNSKNDPSLFEFSKSEELKKNTF